MQQPTLVPPTLVQRPIMVVLPRKMLRVARKSPEPWTVVQQAAVHCARLLTGDPHGEVVVTGDPTAPHRDEGEAVVAWLPGAPPQAERPVPLTLNRGARRDVRRRRRRRG